MVCTTLIRRNVCWVRCGMQFPRWDSELSAICKQMSRPRMGRGSQSHTAPGNYPILSFITETKYERRQGIRVKGGTVNCEL